MDRGASAGDRIDLTVIDYKSIPVQTDIISGIMHLDIESDTCFRDLENYVSSGPGIATLVLRVANSSFYNRGSRITSIPRAISLLGFTVVRSLAMLAFGRAMFSRSRHPLFQLHVWQHSILTAIAAREICLSVDREKDEEEAFIAGLMHDVGKVLLFAHRPERYLEVLAMILENGVPSVAAEQQILGCDHVQVGREAVRQWKLPDRFTDFMGTDLSVPNPELTADPVRLSLACGNCLIAGSGIGGRITPDIEARKNALAAFGLDAALCDNVAQESYMSRLMNDEAYVACASL